MDRDDMGFFVSGTWVSASRGAPPFPSPLGFVFQELKFTKGLTLKKSFLRAIPHKGTILAVSVTSVSHESRWLTVQIEPTIERSIRTACWRWTNRRFKRARLQNVLNGWDMTLLWRRIVSTMIKTFVPQVRGLRGERVQRVAESI